MPHILIPIPNAPLHTMHVSMIVVDEFLQAIKDLSSNDVTFSPRRALIDRLLYKCPGLAHFIPTKRYDICCSIAMGCDGIMGLQHLYRAKKRALYLFDAWPEKHERIVKICEQFRLHYLFVSSALSARQISQKLSKRHIATKVLWVPEGFSPEKYYSNKNKTIDVLQLGRKYEKLHARIVTALADGGYSYLYEKEEGKVIFPDEKDFIEALAASKISICYPRSITHPAEAQQVSTMTNRYLQSMGSKCLVVGETPKEMLQLFKYQPVVTLSLDTCVAKLTEILEDVHRYDKLIEQNYTAVITQHTWQCRWKQILSYLIQCD